MFCGRKKGFFQPAKTALTTRGAIKKANRAASRELNRAAKQIAETYTSEAQDMGFGGMSWQVAEAVARDWMKQNGYRDARLTKAGADGGVDVESSGALAQVKHHAKPVRLPEVQRIYGIAVAERKKALIFGSAGFTPAAQEWANRHGVECYRFPPVRRVK
jgi:HJR/Mrr/RecB family endonuclease